MSGIDLPLLLLDYLDTAAHLEKEWNVEQPQQKFDFAPHVKHHALVHVLQRGLLYNEAERNERQVSSSMANGWQGVYLCSSYRDMMRVLNSWASLVL